MAQAADVVINKRQQRVTYYDEELPGGVTLRMMQIPSGTFLMGSPETEVDRFSNEGPQHEVTVAGFFLGKYVVTQAQWRAVAGLPQVKVKMPPEPSNFKGGDHPVEQVNWYEAEEFCARLSAYTGRRYRLPSEAQWEYACRAGTETPFHFGETITTDLANYCGQDREIGGENHLGAYGYGFLGQYRETTTAVGEFQVANAWGLYDMHGNVWEWCADHWHGNYINAPTNSEAWLTSNTKADRLVRGGSWFYSPGFCRSAMRYYLQPNDRINFVGFRIVYSLYQKAQLRKSVSNNKASRPARTVALGSIPIETLPSSQKLVSVQNIVSQLSERGVEIPPNTTGSYKPLTLDGVTFSLYIFAWSLESVEVPEWNLLVILIPLPGESLPVGTELQVNDDTSTLVVARSTETGDRVYVQVIGSFQTQFYMKLRALSGASLTLPPFAYNSYT